MNYSSLQTEIANYLNRTDLTAQIPTFIGLAESYLFRELHIKELETSVSSTTVTGGYATLPSDFGTLSKISITSNGTARVLDYIALSEVPTTVEQYPGYYSFESGKIRIWGSDVGQAYTMYYVPAISPLTVSNTSNWLLANASELYLYASCLEGARYLRNDAEVANLSGVVERSLDSVKRFTERRGQPATGSMQIRRRG